MFKGYFVGIVAISMMALGAESHANKNPAEPQKKYAYECTVQAAKMAAKTFEPVARKSVVFSSFNHDSGEIYLEGANQISASITQPKSLGAAPDPAPEIAITFTSSGRQIQATSTAGNPVTLLADDQIKKYMIICEPRATE